MTQTQKNGMFRIFETKNGITARRVCAADAPFGEIKQSFEIEQSKCFQCGHCASKCRFGAIVVEYE